MNIMIISIQGLQFREEIWEIFNMQFYIQRVLINTIMIKFKVLKFIIERFQRTMIWEFKNWLKEIQLCYNLLTEMKEFWFQQNKI